MNFFEATKQLMNGEGLEFPMNANQYIQEFIHFIRAFTDTDVCWFV